MHLFCDDSKHLRILVLRDSNMQKDKDMKCVISLNRYCSFNTLILVRNRVRDSVKVIFIDHLEWMRIYLYVTCGFQNYIYGFYNWIFFRGYFENEIYLPVGGGFFGRGGIFSKWNIFTWIMEHNIIMPVLPCPCLNFIKK